MDMVERVAAEMRASLEDFEAPVKLWVGKPQSEHMAKAAIRAMLEGLEPVAWINPEWRGYGHYLSATSPVTVYPIRTWKPLYDLSALNEVVG